MKYKILSVDEDGYVDITAKELEDLLEEAYQEGYDKARMETKKQIEYVPYYPYYPYYDTKKYWFDTPPYVTWCNSDSSTYTTNGSATTCETNPIWAAPDISTASSNTKKF